jgi:hypothetical protein
MIIFFTYVGWDGINFWMLHGLGAFWAASWPTMFCSLLASLTWRFSRQIHTKRGFISLEIWMAVLLVLFRGLKLVKGDVAAFFHSLTSLFTQMKS